MSNIDFYAYKASDSYRLAASRLLIGPVDGTYNLIKIPKYSLVSDVWVQIESAFTADASVEVGWLGNNEDAVEDGFITDDISDSKVIGMKRGFNTTDNTFAGKYFNLGSGAITATVLAGSGTVGNFRVFVQYSVVYA